MLIQFVDEFKRLYGAHNVSINVHLLLHITDDYEKFGHLDSVSCFPFENFLYSLKRNTRQYKYPLQHIIKKYNAAHEHKKKIKKSITTDHYQGLAKIHNFVKYGYLI